MTGAVVSATASTTAWHTLQRQFAAAVMAPRGAAGTGLPVQRLDIYRHAYQLRLIEVLAADYPAVRAELGERAFDRLAAAYVKARPSRHPNLNRFGAGFVQFLTKRRLAQRSMRVGLARLDLAWTQAFDAAEPVLAAIGGSMTAWSRRRLPLHPSVSLLRLPAAVVDRWHALRRGERIPLPRGGRIDVCVRRFDDGVVWTQLPSAAAQLLRRLQRGVRFGPALAAVPAGAPLQQWFASFREGVFGFVLPA